MKPSESEFATECADFFNTIGQYPVLLEHINVHRYYMGEAAGHEVSMAEALQHWHSEVYAPVVELIRARGLLRDFADRTEADLYLWLTRHRDELADALGWDVSFDAAASSLGAPAGNTRRPGRDRLERMIEPSADVTARDDLRRERIVRDLLVFTDGGTGSSRAIDLAFTIAGREGARLYGLAVDDGMLDDAGRRAVSAKFDQRCTLATRTGQLVFAPGDATGAIVERSRLVDLVVAPYTQDPCESSRTGILLPDLRSLLRRCPRPVLCVPSPHPDKSLSTRPIARVLLAYDASPKASEALLIAAYLAGWWGMHLTVLTVVEFALGAEPVEHRARELLASRNIAADYVRCRGNVANAVLQVMQERATDILLMGGHGHGTALDLVLGSATTQVLKRSELPVLVCQ